MIPIEILLLFGFVAGLAFLVTVPIARWLSLPFRRYPALPERKQELPPNLGAFWQDGFALSSALREAMRGVDDAIAAAPFRWIAESGRSQEGNWIVNAYDRMFQGITEVYKLTLLWRDSAQHLAPHLREFLLPELENIEAEFSRLQALDLRALESGCNLRAMSKPELRQLRSELDRFAREIDKLLNITGGALPQSRLPQRYG